MEVSRCSITGTTCMIAEAEGRSALKQSMSLKSIGYPPSLFFSHLHLSRLACSRWSGGLCRSILNAVLAAVKQHLHHIQRLRLCGCLKPAKRKTNKQKNPTLDTATWKLVHPGVTAPLIHLHVGLLAKVHHHAPAEICVVILHLWDHK